MAKAEIAIIGGTGVSDIGLENCSQVKMHTPFGAPSDMVTLADFKGVKVAFLPRHGHGHRIAPHIINFRANIWAFKELGVKCILAPSAVGSLREEMKPGHIVFPDQFIDRTHGRTSTFYEGDQVCHVSTAEPFCAELRSLLVKQAEALKLDFHGKGTYICINGPRFSTKAESHMFRQWGADIVGMTVFPECVLAREAEICYAPISMVTDYDCWKDHPVSNAEVLKTMKENVQKTRALVAAVIPKLKSKGVCGCGSALKDAMM